MASNTIQFDATVDAAALNRLLSELRTGTAGAAKAINDLLGGTVTKKIVLEEVANGKGGKQLVAVEKERLSVTDQLISRQRVLSKTQEGSVTSLRQQLNNLKQARDATVRYETSVAKIGGSLRQQRAEWGAINAEVSRVSRELAVASASGFWDRIKVATRSQGLINISNGLVELTQGFQAASILAGQFLGAINSVVDASAKLQSFALSFKAIGAGSAGAVSGLQESARIALGLGVDLNNVQEGFKQLSPVVLNSGGTLKDVSSIVESLSSRFAAFGISGDRARRVMNGVIQAFAKGKLQAEELTQQISEADPAFKTDLAAALLASKDSLGELGKSVDGTVPGLEKLVKAGELTADVLIKVLPQVSKADLLFGKLGPSAASAVDGLERGAVTIDQVRANLQNLNDLSLRELALSSEPLINALLRVQAVVTDAFSRISQSTGIDILSGVAAKAVEIIARLADTFFVLAEGAINIVGALKPIIDLIQAILNIPGATELAGLAILGNLIKPLNLLERRVASSKAAWQGFRDGFSNIFVEPKQAIDEIRERLQRFNKSLEEPAKIASVEGDTVSELERQLAREEARLEERRRKLAEPAQLGAAEAAGAAGSSRGQSKLEKQIAREKSSLEALQRLYDQRESSAGGVVDPGLAQAQGKLARTIDETKAKLQALQARLSSPGPSDGSTLTGKESKRQEKLRQSIEATENRIRGLQDRLAAGNFESEASKQ
jgi:tape measure domain-containing protein